MLFQEKFEKNLRMEWGEPLEIFTDEDCVILKKYHITPIRDEIEDLKNHLQDYYERNENFTQKQINEFKNTLSTIQKAFKDE